MHKRWLRPLLTITLLAITVIATLYFFRTHPEIGRELQQTSLLTIGIVLALYLLFMGALGLVFKASVMLCRTAVPTAEMVLLTAYSSIINFFGPLQSGPAFRALYLKKRHGVSLRNYTAASLLNYFFYALYSVLLLVSGLLGWWTVGLGLAGLAAGYAALKLQIGPLARLDGAQSGAVVAMAAAVLLQVGILTAVFYTALHSVNSSIGIDQALIYTGAANLALFVSITPGAIGFRESFVFLAQRLHNIDTATIVSASLIDRGAYVIMLLGLAVILFFSQTGKQLNALRKTRKA